MEVFRISNKKYAAQLTASGSANRWNEEGQYVIYTGSSRSLSTLELIVHRSAIKPTLLYKVMVIHIEDEDIIFEQIRSDILPKNWRSVAAYSKLQRMGAAWYTSKRSLILKIPSAIIPQEYNYIINTKHPDFKEKVQLIKTEDYFWDARLLHGVV